MRFLFPFILIILLLFRLKLKKGDRSMHDRDRMFWERESEANSVRKQDIEHLHYITIPENLPHIETNHPEIQKLLHQLEVMRPMKILNLTGMSNTDIKMEYGPANLPFLSECDDRFTELARTIASLGHLLMEEGFISQAMYYLEFGISCNTDIISNYVDLATLYHQSGKDEKISALTSQAEALPSLSKDVILQKLQAI